MRASVMGCCHLDVFDATAAIPLVVFDANVRELNVSIHVREVPLARPALDVFSRTVRAAGRVPPAAIRSLEVSLIFPFQFLFEDHATHAGTPCGEPVGSLLVRPIQPDVMRQLARLRDTRVERLAGLGASSPAALLEHLATAFRKRDKRRPRPTNDVRHRPDQTLAAQVTEVAILGTGVAVLLAQIRRRHNPKRPRRGKCSHFGSSELVFVVTDSDALAAGAPREVEVAGQRFPRIIRLAKL
jgi:hypothetical protein